MGTNEHFSLFSPCDRELVLRAQIKTGWSTHSSNSYVYHQHKLTHHEVKLILEVVEKAQAIERMEEIRIGLLMLKHKQMIENCRGDGVSTCRICNHDFTHQRLSLPNPIQHCHDCHMMICRRCEIKNPRKVPRGDKHTLCVVCYEERELWKKSGAWLVHSVPHMSISYEELEDIQQQRIKNAKVALGFGPKREDIALVHPYQMEEEDSDDDEAMQETQLHFGKSHNGSATIQPKSSPFEFPCGRKLRTQSLVSSNSSRKSSSDSEDQQTLPQSHSAIKSRYLSKRSGLRCQGALEGINKSRMQQYKERPSASASNSQSTSSSSYSERSANDHDGGAANTLTDHLLSVQVSRIPPNPPPILTTQTSSSRSTSPESDIESPSKHGLVLHQMHLTSSIDSDCIQVSSGTWRQEPVSAITEEIQNEKTVKSLGFSSTPSSDQASPVLNDVGEFKEDRDSKSIDGEEDLFKKISVFSSDTKPVAKAERNVLPSEHSVGSPPSVPPLSGPPLCSPQPHGPPPPGPSPKNLPQGSLTPAQATIQEENSIITESAVEVPSTGALKASFCCRNASGVSQNKHPPPCPNVNDEDREEHPLDEDEDGEYGEKFRARSIVMRSWKPECFQRNDTILETFSNGEGGVSVIDWKSDGMFGSVQLVIHYSDDTLTVTVERCKGLRAMDSNGLSDPYVKLFLTPRSKMQKKFRTKVIPKTLNPIFQEAFSFTNLTLDALQKKTLCVVAMDYDGFSRDDFIGATQIKLYEVLNSDSNEICIKRLLDKCVPKSDVEAVGRGEIHLRIRYSSERNGLVVNVLGARNIAEQLHGECEIFVKCHWITRTQNLKERTKLSPKTNNPEFNEELFIPAALCELSYSSLVVGLWEHRSFKDKLLSEVHFNSFSYWMRFVSNPEEVLQDWYAMEAPLSSSNSLKRKK